MSGQHIWIMSQPCLNRSLLPGILISSFSIRRKSTFAGSLDILMLTALYSVWLERLTHVATPWMWLLHVMSAASSREWFPLLTYLYMTLKQTAQEAILEFIWHWIEKHAPQQRKILTLRPNAPWHNEELRESKHKRRKAERLWRGTQLNVHYQLYRDQ